MKSGKKKKTRKGTIPIRAEFAEKIASISDASLQKNYSDKHLQQGCEGTFEVRLLKNVPYNLNSIGVIMLPSAPFLICSECQATFYVSHFESYVEKCIAYSLIDNPKLLTPNQMRFLRVTAGLTQKEVGEELSMEPTYYSKAESGKSPAGLLSPDKHVRLKLFFAEKFEIRDPDLLFRLNKLSKELEPADVKIPQDFEDRWSREQALRK